MKKLLNLYYIVYILFSILFLLNFIIIGKSKACAILYLFFLLMIIGGKYLLRNKKINISKKGFYICLFLGILVHVILLFLSYNAPYSDYRTFYNNAISYSQSNQFKNALYISIFPHLSGYIYLLGNIMKITTRSYIIVVLVNILFDFLGAYFVYLLLRKNKNKARLATIFWILSPINIAWCTICIPIIIFGTCFLGCILLYQYLLSRMSNRSFLFVSILLGLALGISNLFRPIMIIFIIAIFIHYIFLYKAYSKRLILSFCLIFISYFLVGKIHILYTENVSELKISNLPGWTIYAGSIEPYGCWIPTTGQTFGKAIEKDNFDTVSFHKEFMDKAIKNYKERGIIKNVRFLKNKFYYLTAGLDNLSSEVMESHIKGFPKIITNGVKVLSGIWIILVLYFSILTVIKNFKKSTPLFLSLLSIGIMTSHLLMETSPRYFIPAYVPLFLIVFSLGKESNDESICL